MPRNSDVMVRPPVICPFCHSDHVTATAQKLANSTYWRCESCHQVWHPERLRTTLTAKREGR